MHGELRAGLWELGTGLLSNSRGESLAFHTPETSFQYTEIATKKSDYQLA